LALNTKVPESNGTREKIRKIRKRTIRDKNLELFMMCQSRSRFWFTQKTTEAEPELRMVFGKGKVQRQETVLPALLRAVNARLASGSIGSCVDYQGI
jgi:hypothetical protein